MSRLFIFMLFLTVAAPAVGGEAELASGRYAFVPVAAGALRLDTETGEVSLCVAGQAAPSCTRVSENVRLTVGERARLEAEVTALESRIAALEASQREAAAASDEVAIGRVKLLATRAMAHFVNAVQAMKHDLRGSEL